MGFDGALQLIAQKIKDGLDADACTIRFSENKMLRLMAAVGTDSEKRKKSIPINGTQIAGEAFAKAQTIYVPDIRKDARYDRTYIEYDGPISLLAIPAILDGEIYAVISIYRKDPFSGKQLVLAETLVQFSAPTFYHIQETKTNRQATLDVIRSVFAGVSLHEILKLIAEKISKRLEIPSCLIYEITEKRGEPWCEIVAGVPEGEHEIGLSESLKKHPDVEFAYREKKVFIIDEPFADNRTYHFKQIIEKKKINSILYVPVILNDKVISVIVLDAIGEKENFSAEEKSFCFDMGIIAANLFQRDKNAVNEIEHNILNPAESLAGIANRSMELVLQIRDDIEKIYKIQPASNGISKSVMDNSEKLLLNLVRITTEGKKLVNSVHRIRNIRLT